MTTTIFTVGHSNASLEALVELLRGAGVALVVDVRSAPYSRHQPQFNREPFARALEAAGLRYVFAGDRLGGRPRDPACLDDAGSPDYARVAAQPWFQAALDEVETWAAEAPLALLCAEEDPARCHRHHLIAQVLLGRGAAVTHLRHRGPPEPARPEEPAPDPQLALF